MWSVVTDDVGTIARRDIRTTEFVLTIMCNPRGFHAINQLPDCSKMNSECYITILLTPLHEKFCCGGPEGCGRPLIIHVDDCSVHTNTATEQFMSDHRMIRMPQPPYSPNLAPSDFSLFGRVKNRLEQIEACDADDFFDQLDEILSSILAEELERVFAAGIDRVRQSSEGDGEYLA
jgi:hypothetical protein